jgi:murein DD-endopeptidase MepM/ murein hydrolase activator NlpD
MDQSAGGNPTGERVDLVKKGDTVVSILRDQGATPEEAKAIAATLGPRGRDGGLKEGEKLRILMGPVGPGTGARSQPYRVIVANDTTVEAVSALSDIGKYVAVDVQSMNNVAETVDTGDDDDDDGSGVRLYQSIYETALRNKVPPTVIEDMIRIYSYDVDFQRKVQPGDSFDVFYAGEDEGSTATEKHEVLYASLTVGGETKKYYRFQTPDDAVIDYYDETGKSAKKFLVRKPVNNAIMRSGFGIRRHPILGYVKMHTGVDWATAYGTPIFASVNGVVEPLGCDGCYA